MNPETEVERLLKQDGAVLVRRNKHLCWRLSNGKLFTQSATPSDKMTPLAELCDLRRAMGIVDLERGTPGERREKKTRARHTVTAHIHPAGVVAFSIEEKIRAAGVADLALREIARQQAETIEQLHEALGVSAAEINRRTLRIQDLLAERCWWCLLKLRVGRAWAKWRRG